MSDDNETTSVDAPAAVAESCANCHFWRTPSKFTANPNAGHCHGSVPRPPEIPPDQLGEPTRWPLTLADDFCAGWQPAGQPTINQLRERLLFARVRAAESAEDVAT